MKEWTRDYLNRVTALEAGERELVNGDRYRLQYHLMPPVGWMNDPNGLCQHQGNYHVFFQYGPLSSFGGAESWGHYTSTDLLRWNYEGVYICPDEEFDRDGAYSGCAFTEDDKMYLFYTGNVKEEGDYDYILAGRQANQIIVSYQAGTVSSDKNVILRNQDYPGDFTCHVRDPKVWRDGSRYYMVLGGRKTDDRGAVLLYDSEDLYKWSFKSEITSPSAFGYMWECPDYLEFGVHKFLAVCPQGLPRGEYRYQNIYQAGYFPLNTDLYSTGLVKEDTFREWDMGFDFYAPQTFQDDKGRRILIGWMGLPDIEKEYQNPTTAHHWQHALTVPRVITLSDGMLCQWPVQELEELRHETLTLKDQKAVLVPEGLCDIMISEIKSNVCRLQLGSTDHGLFLIYEDGVMTLHFTGEAGSGRQERKAMVGRLKSLRVLTDTSSAEIFVNEGAYVFTTRFYPEDRDLTVKLTCSDSINEAWILKNIKG